MISASLLTPEARALRVATLSAQISLSIARANWWTAYANTPANLARKVYHGGGPWNGDDGALFTPAELITDAMRTADTHLKNAQDALEALNELGAE